MANDLDLFGSWAELTDALKPKSLKGRKKLWWHVNKRVVSEKRNRRHKQNRARAEKAFVKRAIDGPRDKARGHAMAALALANEARATGKPGRWLELLRVMGDWREWRNMELAATCGLTEMTSDRYLRVMRLKGFVSKADGHGGLWKRTELGANVVGGLVEWRILPKPNVNRWKYRHAKQAKARATGEDSSS